MGRVYTRDDVLRLAPDASSAKSGQELAHVRKWDLLGADGSAVWGLCQGSGSKPYQVQIDLAEPAFKCSCPSRKFPCKHGLGLLLILAASPDAMARAARPDWVDEWLASRVARAAHAAEKPSSAAPPRDPAAQAKRREKRMERARSGVSELSSWLRDMVRGGIGAVPGKGFDYFDRQARRMVDAQAPGAARFVRELGSLAAQGTGWERPFVERLSLLHLLTRAAERIDSLPEALRATVVSVMGIPTAANESGALPPIADTWQVISQEVELDDRLRVQRTWLHGETSRRAALVLQFAHGAAAFEAGVPPGTRFHGELAFAPGGGPRALIRGTPGEFLPLATLEGCDCVEEVLDRYSLAIAECPWLERLGLPLCRVTPSRVNDQWWVIDSAGDALPAGLDDDAGYTLLALSGGAPLDMAAEYDGQALRPLSAVTEGRFVSLSLQRGGGIDGS